MTDTARERTTVRLNSFFSSVQTDNQIKKYSRFGHAQRRRLELLHLGVTVEYIVNDLDLRRGIIFKATHW